MGFWDKIPAFEKPVVKASDCDCFSVGRHNCPVHKNEKPVSNKWKEPMPASLMAYLDAWVPTATHHKARYSHSVTGSEMNFFVFICSCGSNINIGQSQFSGIGNQVANDCAVPFALQEWVKEHRHVCEKFHASLVGPLCGKCDWNKEAHDQSMTKEMVDFANDALTKWQKQMIENHAKLKAAKAKEIEQQEAAKVKAAQEASENKLSQWESYNVKYTDLPVQPGKSEGLYYSKETVEKLKKKLFIKGGLGKIYNVADPFEYDDPPKAAPVPVELPVLEQPTGRKFRK